MAAFPYELGPVLLAAEGVHLTLAGRPILRDLDIQIRDIRVPGRTAGQVVGLLGPSGIGKTQLFRVLAGLSEPDRGSVRVGTGGERVRRGMVGVVAQSYPLFMHRTVLGNLLVAGKRAGLKREAARAKAVSYLRRFDLDEHARKYPAQLSGGQRQRVAIAQQFMCSEHFLLMDEPFSGLDPVALDAVIGLIEEVAGSDELNTIIVVTHDIAAALEVADTIWLLGRDRDAAGAIVPGARVQESYNLIERGLAYRNGVSAEPEFVKLLGEIRRRFPSL